MSRVIDAQKNNQLKYNFTGGSGDRSEGLLQSSYLEPGCEPAATTTRDISPDIGRQLSQSAVEFEDLMGHHGDGPLEARLQEALWESMMVCLSLLSGRSSVARY